MSNFNRLWSVMSHYVTHLDLIQAAASLEEDGGSESGGYHTAWLHIAQPCSRLLPRVYLIANNDRIKSGRGLGPRHGNETWDWSYILPLHVRMNKVLMNSLGWPGGRRERRWEGRKIGEGEVGINVSRGTANFCFSVSSYQAHQELKNKPPNSGRCTVGVAEGVGLGLLACKSWGVGLKLGL